MAALNARTANSSGSTIGAGWVRMRRASKPINTIESASSETIEALDQPQLPPCTIATVSRATPAVSIIAPGRSGRAVSGWRISRSTRRPAIRPAIPTGTLTMNTHRQPACTSRPPSGGPAAAAIPPTAAHAPIAM